VGVGLGVDVGIDPQGDADASRRSSSPADSALMAFRSRETASASSAGDLPTPVKTIWSGRKPARRARAISPTELASASAPPSRMRLATASDEFALRA
jgi:hypothetical protein